MGQTNSGLSLEQFKDAVVGTAVLMVARQTDPELKFRSVDKINEQVGSTIQSQPLHTLPILNDPKESGGRSRPTEAELCSNYYSGDRVNAIEQYINQCIINDPDNYHRFMTALIKNLRTCYRNNAPSLAESNVSVKSNREREKERYKDTDREEDVVKGSKRLSEHISKLNKALADDRRYAMQRLARYPTDTHGLPVPSGRKSTKRYGRTAVLGANDPDEVDAEVEVEQDDEVGGTEHSERNSEGEEIQSYNQ